VVKPALVGDQRAEDALPQAVDAHGALGIPVAVRAFGVERSRAAVDRQQAAAADRVVDGAQRAEAELLDLVERRFVGVAAGAREENRLQRGAAVPRDLELVRGGKVSQDA
jgi:hypothetical protein